MTLGLLMQETMSGWMKLDADGGAQQPFSFTIRAWTPRIFSLTAPRAFRGIARFERDGVEVPVQGTVTIYPMGPRYQLDLVHPRFGRLHAQGQKKYSLVHLLRSLTTCPMQVHQAGPDGPVVGSAEAAYRDSVILFPFVAFRLVSEDKAFGSYPALPAGAVTT